MADFLACDVISKWKNYTIVDGELVEIGTTEQKGFGSLVGCAADVYDGKYTYKWDDKLERYVKIK